MFSILFSLRTIHNPHIHKIATSSRLFPYSPFASRISLIKHNSNCKQPKEYWIAHITTFSTSASDPDTIISPTVLRILTIISKALRTRVTPDELAMLCDEQNWRYRAEVEHAFRRRRGREDREREIGKRRLGLGVEVAEKDRRGLE
jgi:hypothetical protein